MEYTKFIDELNNPKKENRLQALRDIKKLFDKKVIQTPTFGSNVNNHIHTTYSFSPYSPTKAVYMAYMNGLKTAGIMDHDSVGGGLEFIEAGKILGVYTTVGVEARVDLRNTPLYGKKINNPDQGSVIYVSFHGIPNQYIETANGFFAPYRINRNKRNIKMVDNINALMKKYNICVDFEKDIIPISQYNDTGSITERHVLYALAKKLAEKFTDPDSLLPFFRNTMGLAISAKVESMLKANEPAYYLYDVLGILKSDLIDKIYIPADEECPSVFDFIKVANAIGTIPTYPYLGDIGESVTGDKKAQKFEDDFLEELFIELSALGFRAITYMPTRNTKEQLMRLMGLCEKYNMYQVSGEDINSPRQSFICKAIEEPEFSHLKDSTWALIGHEREATKNIENNMFSKSMVAKYPDISDRVQYFKKTVVPE